MDQETKITYGVIGLLIIFLGGIAFILQPKEIIVKKESVKTIPVQKNTKQTAGEITAITNKLVATTTMEQQIFTSATITTNKGVIEIAFEKDKPLTVKNFGTLASSKFYDGVRFHRVIKNFMIQTGDPLSKDKANESNWGKGGPGYKFNDELKGDEQYPLGTVAMANSSEANTNGSQFFIVTANPGVPLPPSYTVFGKVTKGIETALAIQEVKTSGSPSDRPLEDIIIEKVEVR